VTPVLRSRRRKVTRRRKRSDRVVVVPFALVLFHRQVLHSFHEIGTS
jgi:hypothetical protein